MWEGAMDNSEGFMRFIRNMELSKIICLRKFFSFR